MDYFLVSVLVLIGLISWGLLSRKMWIGSHRSLQRWANENGYTLVSKKVSWTKIPFRKGPYRWASDLQIVFRVVVIDEQKMERSAPSVDLDRLSERLPEVAARLRRWVLEAGDEDVALILKALDLHIRASSKEVQIEGAMPLIDGDSDTDLVTIVQTSA